MSEGISQRLLRDAKQAELDVGADPRAIVRTVEQHASCVLALCLGTERIHSGDQSDMLQNTRVKVVSKEPHALGETLCLLLHREQRLLHRRVLDPAAVMLEVADGDRHASDLLTQSVVKVARDACPFGLLRGNQPSRQLPCAAIAGTKGLRSIEPRPPRDGAAIATPASGQCAPPAARSARSRRRSGSDGSPVERALAMR